MLTSEAKADINYGEEFSILIVKDNTVNMGKPRVGETSQQHNKSRSIFPQLTQSEGWNNYASFMKDIDEFILDCGGLP